MNTFEAKLNGEIARSRERVKFWQVRAADGLACASELQSEEWLLEQLQDEMVRCKNAADWRAA